MSSSQLLWRPTDRPTSPHTGISAPSFLRYWKPLSRGAGSHSLPASALSTPPFSPHRDPDDLHVDTAVGALCLHPMQLTSSSGPWGPLPPSLTAPPSSSPGHSFPHPAAQAQLLEPSPRGLSLPIHTLGLLSHPCQYPLPMCT